MNKLTPIFIAGALAISAGLTIAQAQMNQSDPMQGHNMPGMSGMEAPPSDAPSMKVSLAASDSLQKT